MFKEINLRTKKLMILLFFLAFTIRIFSILIFKDFYYNTGRLVILYELADNLAQGKGFVVERDFFKFASNYMNNLNKTVDYEDIKKIFPKDGPFEKPHLADTWGYAVLLGIIWKITGSSRLVFMEIFQSFIDTLMVFLIIYIAEFVFRDRKKALIAGFLYSFFPSCLFLSAVPNRTVFAGWALILSTFFYIKFLENERLAWALVSGVIIGLFSWVRPTAFLFPIGLSFHYFIFRKNLKNTFKVLSSMFASVLFIFSIPFSFVYKYYTGSYNYLNQGAALWEGLGEYPNPYSFKCDDDEAYKRALELGYSGERWTPEFNKLLGREARRVIIEHPLFYLKVLLRRTVDSLVLKHTTLPFYSYFEKFDWFIPYHRHKKEGGNPITYLFKHPLSFFILIFLKIPVILVNLLGLLGLWIYRKNFSYVLLPFFIWLYNFGIVLPVHIEGRYLFPGVSGMLILSAGTLYYLGERINKILNFHKNNGFTVNNS